MSKQSTFFPIRELDLEFIADNFPDLDSVRSRVEALHQFTRFYYTWPQLRDELLRIDGMKTQVGQIDRAIRDLPERQLTKINDHLAKEFYKAQYRQSKLPF